ncbi:MAG: tripartite tricarboxylate transporter substrate binding protein [Rhodocyclaceae bacterium]|nr:tripartite tricarboxylate transporter substrate binding protein [Rhodocyclaceae bacterium]
MSPLLALLAALPATLAAGDAQAQAGGFPAKPVRIVVGFVPGGSTDITGRVMAQRLTDQVGQPVVVENRPGAGGNVGAEAVARAPADGYTLMLTSIAIQGIGPALYPKLPFDPIRDFTPITQLTAIPNVLAVHPSLPAKSVSELIALARKRPGAIAFASAGAGTSMHLSAELLRSLANIEVLHVPYKGSAPAMQDLIGGHTQMVFDNLPFVLPFVKAGKVRALAVTTTARNPQLPEVPTMIEAGIAGYDVTSWFGLAAPGGLPTPLTDRWYQESVKALQHPDTRQRFGDLGASIVGSTPVEFGAFIRAELAKWARVVKASGAKAD